MSDKQPIDYARADADVVRKKFRRRVVMFVLATVVVMGIGGGWQGTPNRSMWLLGGPVWSNHIAAQSVDGTIYVYGASRGSSIATNWPDGVMCYGNHNIGIALTRFSDSKDSKWTIAIRYRTLFILAMIPWLITLIRLIRVWKRKRAVDVDGEL